MAKILLIINKSSGIGHDSGILDSLGETIRKSFPRDYKIKIASNHSEIKSFIQDYLNKNLTGNITIIVAGGGGTLRAVIEGIYQSRIPLSRVKIATLRMGSGNVFAKNLGIKPEPIEGLKGIIDSIKKSRTIKGSIILCESPDGKHKNKRLRYVAATLGGLGQFGSIPDDLKRFHEKFPSIRKLFVRILGIEKFTDIEYGIALFSRIIRCAFNRRRCEYIEVSFKGKKESFALLSGVILNFPLKALPFNPELSLEDKKLVCYLIPRRDFLSGIMMLSKGWLLENAKEYTIDKKNPLRIKLLDRESSGFFLDEDPLSFYNQVEIRYGGELNFVAGINYKTRG